jgi:hypothetical protein
MWLKLAKNGKNWQKLPKNDRFFYFKKGFLKVFQVVEHIRGSFRTITVLLHSKNEILQKNRKFHFRSIFANFSHILGSKNHVLKKVGRGRDDDLFIFWYFLNLHALGYPKSVTVFFLRGLLGQQVPQHDVRGFHRPFHLCWLSWLRWQ